MSPNRSDSRVQTRTGWSSSGLRRLSALLTMLLLCLMGGLQFASAVRAQEQRPKNQLGELFRRLDRGIREQAEEIKNSKSARDQFDIRPVQRPEENRRFQQAKDLIRQKKWNNAVEVLQFLMEQPNDAFSVNDAHEFRSLKDEVDRLIGEFPADGMRNYESRYGTAAQQQFDTALETQDEALLISVATHYFHTPAGKRALELLARKWQDQGQFGRSAEAWVRLFQNAEAPHRLQFGRMASRALARDGRLSEAEKIARSLPDAEPLLSQLQQFPPPAPGTQEQNGQALQRGATAGSGQDLNPSLLPHWSASLVERFNAASQIRMLTQELQEMGRTLIPTLQPLAVRGMIALRTLRSLQVRDVSTGTIVWERRMDGSPEDLLTAGNSHHPPGAVQYQFSPDTQTEQHPLASLLFRDEVYGSLSSDGTRLYSVESTGESALSTPMHMWQLRMEGSSARTPWSTNELTAYDLKTGLIRWRLGGIAIEKEFSRPLAGTRFLAAPVPDGPELYVLGERNGEIVLFCLASQSGEVLWEQPLASPGRPIREDLVRSHWSCQPVLTDSLILCPTSCGWMIAVDRVTHRLRWSARFAPRVPQQENFRNSYSTPVMQELNRRWESVVTLVSGNRILATPPELPDEFGMLQPMLYCLDLQTGRTLWEQPKAERTGGNGLYLAGIWNDQAVIVGTHRILGRGLKRSGEVQFEITLPDRPTGRGVLSGDQFLLPVAGCKLLKINLKTSAIEKTLLPAIDHELGNLVIHRGQLLAATYESIVALPANPGQLRENTDPEILARIHLGESRALLADKQFEKLETTLKQILNSSTLSPALRLEVADVQRQALRLQIQMQPQNAGLLLKRLEELSRTPEEQRDFQRIQAKYWLDTGEQSQALSALLGILETFPASERIQDGSLTMRIDSWVHHQLEQLYKAASTPAAQSAFHKEFESRLASLRKRNPDPALLDRWARALAFHTAGLELELELGHTDFHRGAHAAALIRFSRVVESDNPARKSQALRDLATSLEELGWHQDALDTWSRLQALPSEVFADGQSSSELATKGIAAARKALAAPSPTQTHWGNRWTLERVGVSGNERNFETVSVTGSGFQAANELRLIQESDHSRIRIEHRQSGIALTSFPLRSNPSLGHNTSLGARLLASTIFVVHSGILHAITWPDQEVSWTWNSDVNGLALSRMAIVQPHPQFGLQSVQHFAATRQLHTTRSQTGYLQAAGLRALLLHCKDWIALDPLTGEELWRESASSDRSSALELGTDRVILSARSGQSIRCAFSGLPCQQDRLPYESSSRPILITDGDFILLNRNVRTINKTAVHDLQRVTPQGKTIWTTEIPADALVGLPDQKTLIVLRNPAEASLIDLAAGNTIPLGTITELAEASLDVRNGVAVTSDDERIYFYLDNKKVRPFYLSLPAIHLAGKIIAIGRQGERQWVYQTPLIQAPTPSQQTASPPEQRHWALNALTQSFQDSPILLLVGDDEREDPEVHLSFHQIRIIGLDKATGKPLIDWERPSESGGFSYLYHNIHQQTIDLRTYNERIQLSSETPAVTSGSAP